MSYTETPDLPSKLRPWSAEYIHQFGKHQQDLQEHLRGRSPGFLPLHPTYFPPASYWSSSEKDVFFHGLTVYSRLRPDLIAQDIKTKNLFDVCLYLDYLQRAAAQECVGFDEGVTRSMSMMEPALEVSERWVAHEEAMSETLNSVGECFHARPTEEGNEKRRANGLLSSCSCLRDARLDIPPTQKMEDSAPRSDGKEDLAHLDVGSLMAVENIIRSADPISDSMNITINENSFRDDEQPANVTNSGDATAPDKDLPLTNNNVQSLLAGPSDIGDEPQPTSEVTAIKSASNDPEDHLTVIERREQRRLNKRLYMRRKRAEQVGNAVVTEAIKLRPGRQKRERKPPKPRPSTYNTKKKLGPQIPADHSPECETSEPPSQRSQSETINHEGLEYEPHSQSGLTKSYRVRKALQENGIDAEALADMNLDFLHLPTITRLMRLFNSYNGSIESAETTSISADTAQLLVGIVHEFTAEIIRRVIITKEQEVRLKRELKIWKYDKDEITSENILECLNSMGLAHLNKENYFSAVVGRTEIKTGLTESEEHYFIASQHREDSDTPKDKDHPFRTPRFTLPTSMLWCTLPSHRHIFSTDELIPVEINQFELDAQLTEEGNLNMKDEAKSKEYEASLWTTQAPYLI